MLLTCTHTESCIFTYLYRWKILQSCFLITASFVRPLVMHESEKNKTTVARCGHSAIKYQHCPADMCCPPHFEQGVKTEKQKPVSCNASATDLNRSAASQCFLPSKLFTFISKLSFFVTPHGRCSQCRLCVCFVVLSFGRGRACAGSRQLSVFRVRQFFWFSSSLGFSKPR